MWSLLSLLSGFICAMSRLAQRTRRASRQRREWLFRCLGIAALGFAAASIVALISSVLYLGLSAFTRYEIQLDVPLSPGVLGIVMPADKATLRTADYGAALRAALRSELDLDPSAGNERSLQALLSPGAEFAVVRAVAKRPALIGQSLTLAVPFSDDVQLYLKGRRATSPPGAPALLKPQQTLWLDQLGDNDHIRRTFNLSFFTSSDSSYPQLAGLASGIVGSFLAVGLAILIATPLGIATAVFLEEFAPKNRFTDLLEININNLAAVPSIVFGLLGLTVFILFFGLPRSSALVGGLVLSLMTLPTIIITTRAALRALPVSLKEGGQALGASHLDIIFRLLLPGAAPGIITGTILGFAQALGETAPLLLIGMVAFIAAPPAGPMEPASALPVLVYLWAESPEIAFVEKTAGAVIVLMVLLGALNGMTAYARRRFDPFHRG